MLSPVLPRSLRPGLLTVILLAARAGHAADGASLFDQKATSVYAQLGLGTPLGFYGGEVEQTVTSFLALSGGAGIGQAGPQVAFMPRVRLGSDTSAVVAGAGVSYGKYRYSTICLVFCDRSSAVFEGKVTWVNAEAALEHRWPSGLSLRLFLGAGRRVAGALPCTADGGCGRLRPTVLVVPYLGTALGWSF